MQAPLPALIRNSGVGPRKRLCDQAHNKQHRHGNLDLQAPWAKGPRRGRREGCPPTKSRSSLQRPEGPSLRLESLSRLECWTGSEVAPGRSDGSAMRSTLRGSGPRCGIGKSHRLVRGSVKCGVTVCCRSARVLLNPCVPPPPPNSQMMPCWPAARDTQCTTKEGPACLTALSPGVWVVSAQSVLISPANMVPGVADDATAYLATLLSSKPTEELM
jgi:hypothetical protein